jgi:hypothetical protein
MTPDTFSTFSHEIIKDTVFGLSVLSIVLFFNGSALLRIMLGFHNACKSNAVRTSFQLSSRFLVAVLLISVVQMLSILLWTVLLYVSGLEQDLNTAMLFAGSCFTTLGIFSGHLPKSWEAVSFFIAFSGLFSFAIATSVMISMIGVIVKKENLALV